MIDLSKEICRNVFFAKRMNFKEKNSLVSDYFSKPII